MFLPDTSLLNTFPDTQLSDPVENRSNRDEPGKQTDEMDPRAECIRIAANLICKILFPLTTSLTNKSRKNDN